MVSLRKLTLLIGFALITVPMSANAQNANSDPLSHDGTFIGVLAGGAFNGGAINVSVPGGATTLAGGGSVYNANAQSVGTFGVLVSHRHSLSHRLHIISGIEADINYPGSRYQAANGTLTVPTGVAVPAGIYGYSQNSSSNYYGTVRGHFGYALPHADIYSTSGFAFVGNSSLGGGTLTFTPAASLATATYTGAGSGKLSTGPVIGGGGEYSMSNHVVARFEYLHMMMTATDRSFALPSGMTTYTVNESAANGHLDVIRVGHPYQF